MNGSPTNEFNLGRGLRQGDPLSSFLFLLAAKGLRVMINQAVEVNMFTGYKFGEMGQHISHMQFADDTLIVGGKFWSNIWAFKAILQLFEMPSGLKVNFHKSQLLGVNVDVDWLDWLWMWTG